MNDFWKRFFFSVTQNDWHIISQLRIARAHLSSHIRFYHFFPFRIIAVNPNLTWILDRLRFNIIFNHFYFVSSLRLYLSIGRQLIFFFRSLRFADRIVHGGLQNLIQFAQYALIGVVFLCCLLLSKSTSSTAIFLRQMKFHLVKSAKID